MRAILTSFAAAGQLLDLPLGRLEPFQAKAEQLLAALPETDRLVELGLAALEPLDDLLELLLRLLEAQVLVHGRTSSTLAPKPPSASSTSTCAPAASPAALRRTPLGSRTIA
jgi:hypothetical protein